MDPDIFKKLHQEGHLSAESLVKIKTVEDNRLFSLHLPLKTILYAGVAMLSGGLGVLVYKNIDTIGHQAVLAFIAIVTLGCFYYCIRKKEPFSFQKVAAPDSFFDYILLLGCLTLVTFIAYLQFEYSFFGTAYGLATFIPMVLLFVIAYYFDHLGVLSLAITNLATWMGIAATPTALLKENDFGQPKLIYVAILLGIILVLAGLASDRHNLKKHFEFTYTNFGIHILFVSGLAALFVFDRIYLIWFLWILCIAFYFYRHSIQKKSFYLWVVTALYTYIAVSYIFVQLLALTGSGEISAYIGLIYFILSAIGVVRLLMIQNQKMKAHDSI